MNRRELLMFLPAIIIGSCARMEERRPRYDPEQCPFCVSYPGKCFYCDGNGKCLYCKGTEIRKTSTKNYPERGIERLEYEEKCPFCKGSGICRHCEGNGECWACNGKGKVKDWNFYEKTEEKIKFDNLGTLIE